MQALSGLDATFLSLETTTAHMHVGSVSVFEDSLSFANFRKILAARIHLIPRLRQRLVALPLDINRPYWADAPNFNLDLHLNHVRLPQPGGWKQLREFASRVFSEQLDRSRPLWQFYFVEGLETIPQVPPGSIAVISKIHHVAIDGVSGTDMMGALFDTSAEPPQLPPAPPFKPAPLPSEVGIVGKALRDVATQPLRLPGLLARTALGTLQAGVLTTTGSTELPPVPFTAPKTRLNRTITPQRKWNTAILSLDRVKALKNTLGVTVNDIVLAICTQALRRYLREKGELPAEPLVAFVPISTRTKGESGSMGNQVSGMLVQLPTNVADQIEQVRAIHKHTSEGKLVQNAIGAKTLASYLDFVPFSLAGRATRLYSRLHLSERHAPVVNLTVTNVPGPQIDLYLGGHRLLANMGMGPILDGMGLIIPVLSYNGILTFSPTSCPSIMPDLDQFTRYLWESANALEADVQRRFMPPAENTAPAPPKREPLTKLDGATNEAAASAETTPLTEPAVAPPPASAEPEPDSTRYFTRMGKAVADPDFAKSASGRYQFNITGPQPRTWHIDLDSDPRVIKQGTLDRPDATFTVTDAHFMKILRGKLSIQMAFMQGKLKVSGNVQKALKLAPILQKMSKRK